MKKDHPLRMINAGRYKVCFSELNPEIQKDVLKRMERLIEENRQWYDRGNYGHLPVQHPAYARHRRGSASRRQDAAGIACNPLEIHVGRVEARKDAKVGHEEFLRAADESGGAVRLQVWFRQGLAICLAQGHRRSQ